MARIERVHFKANRSRLLSVGRSGTDLHLHCCFRDAPEPVLDAVAVLLRAGVSGAKRTHARRVLREFAAARRPEPAREPRPGVCVATGEQRAYLNQFYTHLNQTRFDGRLPPDVPIRLSGRMSRRFGHVRLATRQDGLRYVVEIALNRDLMLPGNDAQREETMLHEMAHAAAWIWDSSRGHDARWRAWALRVGCEPRACTRARIRRH